MIQPSVAGARTDTSAASAPTASAAQADHPLAWLVMGCTLVGMLLGAADQTIVSAAMPKILSSLAGFNQYAWITTAYLLGVTVTMPLYGKLADLYEAKWIFLFALVLFVTSSALCGNAHSIPELMAFRALQGVGAGAFMPVGIVIMSAFVTPDRRAGVQGTSGGIILFATVAGPVLGGWLTDHGTWRLVFYINVPIGLTVALILAILLPRMRTSRVKARLDLLGTALLALAAIPLLLAASIPAHQRGFIGAGSTGPLLAFAAVCVVLFIAHELRHDEPIVDPRLFRRRFFAVSALTITLLSSITFASLVYIPLYEQGILTHSATAGGLILAPLMLSSISGRFLFNALRRRHGQVRIVTLACLGLVIAGAAALFLLQPSSSSVHVFIALVALGAGLGAGNMLLFAAALSPFPKSRYGQATGMLLFLRSLGGAIITGLLGSVLTVRFVSAMASNLPHGYRWLLHSKLAALYDNPRLLLNHQLAGRSNKFPVIHAMRESLGSSLHDIFTIMLAMALVAFLMLIFFPFRVTRQAEAEAAIVTESGVAAVGEVVFVEPARGSVPTTQEANTIWDIMCHVLYWRHGAVQFAEGQPPTRHAFNTFEDTTTLPTTLHDGKVSVAFERAWAMVRYRTALDRYRAESMVTLLQDAGDLPGDIVTCGGSGEGAALLLAMISRDVGLGKKVYYFEAAPAANGDSVVQDAAARTAILSRDAIAEYDLDGILVPMIGPFRETLARLTRDQRFCFVHVDSNPGAVTLLCLAHLLPRAAVGAPIVMSQYYNSKDGAMRIIRERLAGTDTPLIAGPLPSVHFFAPVPARSNASVLEALDVDWSSLAENRLYLRFLHWIGDQIAETYAGAEASKKDRHIVASIEKLDLSNRADEVVTRFADRLDDESASFNGAESASFNGAESASAMRRPL